MEPSNQSNDSKTVDDVIDRRLKNRERQRRYRERKRVEADACNADITNQSSHLQIVPLLTNGTVEQFVTRVHCKRDWKRDARRVHLANKEAIMNGLSSSSQSLGSENHLPHVFMGKWEEQTLKNEVPSENCNLSNDGERMRSKRRRRDWKAEARNKK